MTTVTEKSAMSARIQTTEEVKESIFAEVRLSSAIICSLPVVISLVLSIVNPSYLSLLYKSDTGLMVLFSSMGFLGLGAAIIGRMGRSIRGETRRQAEKRAASLGPRMTIPMISCILPSLFLIVMGPAFIELNNRISKPVIYTMVDTNGKITPVNPRSEHISLPPNLSLEDYLYRYSTGEYTLNHMHVVGNMDVTKDLSK